MKIYIELGGEALERLITLAFSQQRPIPFQAQRLVLEALGMAEYPKDVLAQWEEDQQAAVDRLRKERGGG